jgi:hypothetical protein
MTRESIQKLLRSKEVDLPGWAESAEHLAGVERLLGVLAEPTREMADAVYASGFDIYWNYRDDGRPGDAEDVWRAMFKARFG